jgi:hypothetical protein
MSQNNSKVKAHPIIRHAGAKLKERIRELERLENDFDEKIDQAILESKRNLKKFVYKDELL